MLGKTTAVAAQAYAASQKLNIGLDSGAKTSFADELAGAVGTVVNSGRKADDLKAKAAAGGRPELVDVVTATAESELALETLVAVRDKVIQAYDDIMRMPI